MQVHRGLDHLPLFQNSVVSIGVYDGVHFGHRTIINRVIEKAKEIDGESIILTFDPHPRQVVYPDDKEIRLLTSLDEKIALLDATGLDHVVIVPFTVEFSQINPYHYVEDILINKLNVNHIIIGYDHKFGLNRGGDIHLLKSYEKKGSFVVEEISRQDVDDLRVSSTKIRNHLHEGDIHIANKLLGYTYELTGVINKGSQIAGKLGYPTANSDLKEKAKLVPAPGTYAATAECEGKHYEGMLYIGKSPTLQSLDEVVIEMNLFATIEEPLYGKEIIIRPEKRYRGDKKFDSVDQLMYNIAADKTAVEHHFLKKKESSLITTAILNYNGQDFLDKYLPSHRPDASQKVMVFDNASTDQSVSVAERHEQVAVIQLAENTGFAGGYNNALPHVGSPYVAIVNSDIQVTEGWLDPILTLMESDPSIGAVQPKIKSVDRPDEFEYAGASGGFLDSLGYPYCRGRILNEVELDQGQYDVAIPVDWSSGAAMVIRTELYKNAGGFDSDFFAHMEEIDLCWRIRRAGYKIICEPSSVVYHVGGGTLTYDSPRKAYLNVRNNYWMVLKNQPVSSLVSTIPCKVMIDFLYALSFLLKGKVSHTASVFKGMIAGLGGIRSIGVKRKRIQYFLDRYSIGREQHTSSKIRILPISYYLLGKKKYKDL